MAELNLSFVEFYDKNVPEFSTKVSGTNRRLDGLKSPTVDRADGAPLRLFCEISARLLVMHSD